MENEKPIPIGTDGKPMTEWQIWLKRLCFFMVVWGTLELFFGLTLLFATQFFPGIVSDSLEGIRALVRVNSPGAWAALGLSALVGALLNIVIAFLGIRGAENPNKIALFFWITLIDAVVTAWSLAGNISIGVFDPSTIISGLFIIMLATCAWQVRKQTGYFNQHP